jgi:hypothetical protein
MRTLIGYSTIENFARDDISASVLLKRLSILFDNVVFNSMYCPIGENDFFKTQSDFLSRILSDRFEESSKLSKNKKFQKIFINCNDFIEDEEKFERGMRDSVPEEIINRIFSYAYKKEMPEGEIIHTREFKLLCGDMWRDIQLYSSFRNIEPNIAGNLSSNFGHVITDFSKNEGLLLNELVSNSTMIPDFGDLSWDQIIELREDKYIFKFRKKVEETLKTSQSSLSSTIDRDIISGLWDIATYAKPKIGMTVLDGILTNLPSPLIVNPYGVYKSVSEVIDKKKSIEHNGWVFFIQNARRIYSNDY